MIEEPIQFNCNGKRLYGILHISNAGANSEVVITMVNGGPQTRVGSHRLYVQLARFLCQNGISILRFDYEGIGDSDGDFIGFRQAGASIHAGIEYLKKHFLNHPKNIIWSICDGSIPSINYAASNPDSIAGLILCNPFTIIDGKDLAQTILKHYYLKRLMTIEFWVKLFSFKVKIRNSKKSLIETVKNAKSHFLSRTNVGLETQGTSVPEQFIRSLIRYPKSVKIILSSNDLAANNFIDFLSAHKEVKKLLSPKQISQYIIEGGDHTFTVPEKKMEMFKITLHAIHEILNSGK